MCVQRYVYTELSPVKRILVVMHKTVAEVFLVPTGWLIRNEMPKFGDLLTERAEQVFFFILKTRTAVYLLIDIRPEILGSIRRLAFLHNHLEEFNSPVAVSGIVAVASSEEIPFIV